jgi:DNA ligase (NAD+)
MASTQEIVSLLREAAAAYYNGGEPKMDDDVYDGLVERLKQMDPEHPFLDEVGAPPPQGAVALPYPMPSLDKIKPGEDALRRFLQATGFVMSEKLDGLSALWEKNRLYLRGDGLVGVVEKRAASIPVRRTTGGR